MGGENEKTVAGGLGLGKLRIHHDTKKGEVHVHDDTAKVKFTWPAFSWTTAYNKLRSEVLKSNMGLLIDDNRIELHATLSGRKVVFGVRSPVTGLEEFDKFAAEILKDDPRSKPSTKPPEKK